MSSFGFGSQTINPTVLEILDDDEEFGPLCVPSPYYKYRNLGIPVQQDHMRNLETTGMNVVDAYLSLLVNACHESQESRKDHLAAVQCGAYPWIAQQGYSAGAHNFRDDKSVHFLPGFFGHHTCGHWTAIIIDNECAKENGGALVFIDSIESSRSGHFRQIRSTFQESPNSDSSKRYVLMESPRQAPYSNDCAVFMLGAFAHWALRSDIAHLPTRFQLKTGVTTAHYGCQMRRHIYQSIKESRVKLKDQILHSMLLS